MEKIGDKLKQLGPKKVGLIALIVIAVVTIIIIAISTIDRQQKITIVNEIRESSAQYESKELGSPNKFIGQLLRDDTAERTDGLAINNTDMEILARKDDWVAVHAISLRMSNYGNQFYAIYQKENGEYKLKASGSVLNPEEYADLSVPREIFESIKNHTSRKSDSRLQAILDNSPSKTFPIINSLPISNGYYEITYDFGSQADVNSFYLYVNALYGYNNVAINNLINAGFDPGDYTILFNNDIVDQQGGDGNE